LNKLWLISVKSPAELQPQHERFVKAYLSLAKSHRAVCEKFGGAEGGSLRYERTSAVETLDKFRQNRRSWIDPIHHVNVSNETL